MVHRSLLKPKNPKYVESDYSREGGEVHTKVNGIHKRKMTHVGRLTTEEKGTIRTIIVSICTWYAQGKDSPPQQDPPPPPPPEETIAMQKQ